MELSRNDIMNTDWVRLLLKVEKRRQLYIGDGDLLALWHFIGGYCLCSYEHNPGVDRLSHAFDSFVHEYYNDSRSTSLYQLVVWNTDTKEEAFEKFFELFHCFLDKAMAGE